MSGNTLCPAVWQVMLLLQRNDLKKAFSILRENSTGRMMCKPPEHGK
jgi:hypothetical protein